VLDVVETGELNCFACMLGGPEGRRLFMMVAPDSDPEVAASGRDGRILVTEVDVPHAGLP
jgi:sugar lactone lactonase YvrE